MGPRGLRRGGGRLVARCIVLDAEHVLQPGEIAWDACGRITSLRKSRDRAADIAILPGLVNAHAHAQIAPLDRAPRGFVPWVGAVMAARGADTAAAERLRTLGAASDLLHDGVTAIGDIDSTGRSLATLAETPLAGRCYRELTGFHLDAGASRRLVDERRTVPRGALRTGLSPHAPYSASPDLFAAARRTRQHLAIHCAETPEEQLFLHTGRGPFADLLAHLGRLPDGFRAPRVGAVRWLEHLAVLGPRTQLIHCQELERGDVARIAASGASIVVCPGTIAWFRRRPPPVPQWLAAGIPVALGTDSRASNRVWSLRAEMAGASRLWPQLRAAQVFAMATSHGATALGMPRLGRLRRGGRADFLVQRAAEEPADPIGDLVSGTGELLAAVAGGVPFEAKSLRR